jgi:hypothetical protein
MMNVIITTPAKGATQSGRGKTNAVVLEYTDLTARRPEPLMGWVASSDTLNQVRLKFPNIEAAVAHATTQGWTYQILPSQARRVVPRNYTDNFKYVPPVDEKGKRA